MKQKVNTRNNYGIFNSKSLLYFFTSILTTSVSMYFSLLTKKAFFEGTQIQNYWTTIGTDFFGIIGQISFSQFGFRLFSKKGEEKILRYFIPLAFALFHTFFELIGFLGIKNFDTSNGPDLLDIPCYLAGAFITSLLPAVFD